LEFESKTPPSILSNEYYAFRPAMAIKNGKFPWEVYDPVAIFPGRIGTTVSRRSENESMPEGVSEETRMKRYGNDERSVEMERRWRWGRVSLPPFPINGFCRSHFIEFPFRYYR
jgi:hypothetical protein